MTFHVLTLFPEMIAGGLLHSVIKRAADSGLISINCVQIRGFSDDKHLRVDDYPFGGGCGMLMRAEPVFRAFCHTAEGLKSYKAVYLTPQGRPFNQAAARAFSAEENLILLCGRYEGIDERVIEAIAPEEVSLGDFVLTGGELAAMAVIDAVARLIPGVLNKDESSEDESFTNGLLEYPQYTQPREWRGCPVPEILLSGHHGNIGQWRLEQSLKRTREKRPELPGGKA